MRLTGSIVIISMLFSLGFSFPDDFIARLQRSLNEYYNSNTPIKLHVFLNQPQYAPGDTVFYKLTALTARQYQRIPGRQIVYVKLADAKGKTVHYQKILIKDSWGYNQLPLSPSMSPGIYTLIAYNDWMQNGNHALFFYKQIPIGNVVPLAGTANDTVKFFPEGGNLIASVSNKVVVTGPLNTTGIIVDDKDQTVSEFAIGESGFGVFYLLPNRKTQYFARWKDNNVPLPDAVDDKVGMLASIPKAKAPVRIILQAGKNSPLRNQPFKFVLSAHNETYFFADVTFAERQSVILSLPSEKIPSGIVQATLFDPQGNVYAERLLYIKNDSEAIITSSADRNAYKTREKITLKFQVKNSEGKPVKCMLGVAAFSDVSNTANENSLKHYLYFNGELAFNGNPVDFQTDSDIDNFLVTQSWLTYSWNDVWNAKKRNENSLKRNLHFKGKLVRANDGVIPDSTTITFFLQRDVMWYFAHPDSDGTFDFPLIADFWDTDEVFYRVDRKGKILSDVTIMVEDEIKDVEFPRPSFKIVDSVGYDHLAHQKRKIEKAYRFKTEKSQFSSKSPQPHGILEDEIFGPDVVVNLDKYLRFPTMEETLREIIPFVQHRWNNKRSVVRIWLDDIDQLASGDPVYVIDGVMTDDTDYFMNLRPEDISAIKVVYSSDKRKPFGIIGRNGIILVETKSINNASLVPRSKYHFLVQGLNKAIAFTTVTHQDAALTRIPDLRSTLYWNPQIEANDEGFVTVSFYASDVTGKFKIVLDGLTSEAEPVYHESQFEVKFEKAH